VEMETTSTLAEVHTIPVWEPWGAWCGVILYYAVLAYPHPPDRERRVRFARALEAYRFKKCGAKRNVVPSLYRKLKSEKVSDTIDMGFRRIALRRLNAAQIGHLLCLDGLPVPYENPKPGGPEGVIHRIDVKTVNAAVKFYIEYREKRGRHAEPDSARANAEHRVWADSLPVLHLAIALWQELPRWEEACTCPRLLPQVLLWGIWVTTWLRPALTYAEGLRLSPYVHEHIPTFRPQEAIRLLPAQNPSTPFGL
jgi:hypothetical protein